MFEMIEPPRYDESLVWPGRPPHIRVRCGYVLPRHWLSPRQVRAEGVEEPGRALCEYSSLGVGVRSEEVGVSGW